MMKGFRNDSEGAKLETLVARYLASMVNERLRRHIPGLQLSLNMFMYNLYGRYPGELIFSNPRAFIDALYKYFRDRDVVVRIIRYILRPLEDSGEAGVEAVRALLEGRWEDFRKLTVEALKDRAREWYKL